MSKKARGIFSGQARQLIVDIADKVVWMEAGKIKNVEINRSKHEKSKAKMFPEYKV